MLPEVSTDIVTAVLVTAFASAIAGRLVDFSAVWFLFHPYRKIDLPLIRELGVLPRRQEALADQVANLIEERLITREGISAYLTSETVAAKVRQTVREAVRQAADRPYPSIRDLLAAELGSAEQVDREIRVLADWAGEKIATLLRQPAFQSRMANLTSEVLEQRRRWPLEDLLPPGLFEAIDQYLTTRWDALASDAPAIAAQLDGHLAELGPITEFLPQATLDWARSRIKERLPDWLATAEELLQEPQVKAALKTYVLDILERIAASNPSLFTFEGLLGAWRQLFPDDFSRRLEGFIDVTIPKLRKALEDPGTHAFIAARVDMAVDEISTTPLGTYYRRLPERARREVQETLAVALSSPNVRRSVKWVLDRILARARTARLEEILPAEVFRHDPIARRVAELADLDRAVLPEYLLSQIERILPAERMGPIVEAASAKLGPQMADLLDREAASLDTAQRREFDLYGRLLRGEAIQPVESESDWVARAIRTLADSLTEEPAHGTLKGWFERGVGRLLAIPIGVPRELVGEDRLAQVEDIAVGQILALLSNHSHTIAQAIDLKDMIRDRIGAADPRAIEEVVKGRLAKREFNTIFLIGLLFGGVVGLLATALFHWIGLWGSWPAVLTAGLAIILLMLRIVRV